MGKLNGEKKRKDDLTVEELRTYPGLEQLSDEEAEHFIASIKELTLLACIAAERLLRKESKNRD